MRMQYEPTYTLHIQNNKVISQTSCGKETDTLEYDIPDSNPEWPGNANHHFTIWCESYLYTN